MNTYQVIYRLPDEQKHWFFIKADDDEYAAYEALDFAKSHNYNLLDVKLASNQGHSRPIFYSYAV